MERFAEIVSKVDDFVWGPVMLVLLVGTGIFLTFRTRFLTWRNLGYALKSTLSKEARTKSRGEGDVSPFSALTTALAATIGTGNIVGVATAMVSGGPGALVWMWISAAFGLTSKFSECMLAIKYREVNEKGEMSGGPMYTMKKGLKNKKLGAVLAWFFALFAVIASFGIGNMTQGNSISGAIKATFHVPTGVTGIVITVLSLLIIVGGIKSISKVSSVVVPVMAIFYVICGVIVIIGNIANLPAGVAMIFKMAFSVKAVGGGLCGTIVASIMGDEDTSERLNYKIAEYSLAVVKDKPNFHISFIMNVSPECDCWNHNDAAIVPDLGILASTDPVALDKACADMVIQAPILHTGNRLSAGHEHDDLCGHDKFHMMHPDTDWLAGLRHAEKIGLGNMQYELVKI